MFNTVIYVAHWQIDNIVLTGNILYDTKFRYNT